MNVWSVITPLASICALVLIAGPGPALSAPETSAARRTAAPSAAAPPSDAPPLHQVGSRDMREPRRHGTALVTPQDTIDGNPIVDRGLVERIERVAAAIPAQLLALQPRLPAIRYVAQGFGTGDEAPVFTAIFQDPAAALAFGCALDDEPPYPCELVQATAGPEPYEEIPGVRCVPMRMAVGAPAFEPDRCEANG